MRIKKRIGLYILVMLFISIIMSFNVSADIAPVFKEFKVMYDSGLIQLEPFSPYSFTIINSSGQINISEIKVQYIIFDDSTRMNVAEEINETLKFYSYDTTLFIVPGRPYEINLYYNNTLIYSASAEIGYKTDGAAGFFSYAFLIGLLALPILVVIGILLTLIHFRRKKRKKFKKKILFLLLIIISLCSVRFGLAMTDLNLNNNQNTTTVNVVDTGEFTLNFVPAILNNNQLADFNNNVVDHFEFFKKVYPLADDKLSYTTSNPVSISSSNLPTALPLFQLKMLLSEADRTVGLFSQNLYPQMGRASRFIFTSVLANELSESTTAHEIGHTFQLCDEYNISIWDSQLSCPNANDGGSFDSRCVNTSLPDYPNLHGCPIEDKNLIGDFYFSGNPPTYLINMMGGSSTINYLSRWIDKESYQQILNEVKKEQVPQSNVAVIRGFVGSAGDITLEEFYVVNNSFVSNESDFTSGNYSFVAKDSNNNILYQFNFTPSFEYSDYSGNVTTTNESYFLFTIPYDNLSTLKFFEQATLKANRTVSTNTPQISLASIDNSSLISEPFNLIWNASDADNDTLHYAILASLDGGDNYTTLEVDYNQTSYEVDPNDFTYSGQYLFKVLVTDGINTNNDITNIFTMGVHPSDLFINVKTVNDTYNDVNGTDTVTLDYITISPQYSSIFKFSNNLSTENVTFTAGQSITRYLRLPKYINVTSAKFNISGRGVQE
ncbi:MAG: hypothetical protein Q8R47_02175 [Nanoarchaeota archaeon]|nr:hypothetical protein [Nanoarchaeota archaeon]